MTVVAVVKVVAEVTEVAVVQYVSHSDKKVSHGARQVYKVSREYHMVQTCLFLSVLRRFTVLGK